MVFLQWVAGYILNWLLNLLKDEVLSYEAKVKLDKERGVINEGNIKSYEEAKARHDRIDAATDLLNGAKP